MKQTNFFRWVRPNLANRQANQAFWLSFSLVLSSGLLAGCASPSKEAEEAESVSGAMGASLSVTDGQASDQEKGSQVGASQAETSQTVVKQDQTENRASPTPKREKTSRRKKAREGNRAHSGDSTKEMAQKPAGDQVSLHCTVRLPDDDSDHPELCRNFRIVLLEEDGTEVSRFRFNGVGTYSFSAEPGKVYRLKPLVTHPWKFSVKPTSSLRAGDQATITFVQGAI